MDLKPFISNASSWRKHFQETSRKGYNGNKRFHTVQEGSGFPLNNLVSISPTKHSVDIAKSEIIEINKAAAKQGRVYKKRKNTKHTKKKIGSPKNKNKRKPIKKKILTHKKKR